MNKCADCIHDKVCDMWAVDSGLPFANADTCAHFSPKSRYIELPCDIGTTVYEIRAKGERTVYKHRKYDYAIVTNFSLHNAIEWGAELYIKEKAFTKTDRVRLHKTVFLAKEEAEHKLKEYKK